MLDYGFWYDVAKYGNENWKAYLSEKEVADAAYTYKCEYDWSKANGSLSGVIGTVLEREFILACYAILIYAVYTKHVKNLYWHHYYITTMSGMKKLMENIQANESQIL